MDNPTHSNVIYALWESVDDDEVPYLMGLFATSAKAAAYLDWAGYTDDMARIEPIHLDRAAAPVLAAWYSATTKEPES